MADDGRGRGGAGHGRRPVRWRGGGRARAHPGSLWSAPAPPQAEAERAALVVYDASGEQERFRSFLPLEHISAVAAVGPDAIDIRFQEAPTRLRGLVEPRRRARLLDPLAAAAGWRRRRRRR